MGIESISGMSTSLQGIYKSQSMLNQSAQNVATGDSDLAKETVTQITAEKTEAANVEVVRTRDEMLEELMNMRR